MIIILNRYGFFSNFLKYLTWDMCKGDNEIYFHFVDLKYQNCDMNIKHKNIWYTMFEKYNEYSDKNIMNILIKIKIFL